MKAILLIISLFFLSCSQNSVETRNNIIQELTENKFNKKIYSTNYLDIYSLQKLKNNNRLIIYIEGDGMSWIDRFTISSNPTPINPVGFKLALTDTEGDVIYLARPCQYIWSKICEKNIWTYGQYSKEVLDSYEEIINELSLKYLEIHVVGYSGGAAIAMYLGSIGNENVKSIRTIAGNINHHEFTKLLNIRSLKDSINFYKVEERLVNIPQNHYYGTNDKVIPQKLYTSYLQRNMSSRCIEIVSVADVGHSTGWSEFWKINNKKLPICS
jgi:pimeloyl-ACP methyl ester carboxylesterase